MDGSASGGLSDQPWTVRSHGLYLLPPRRAARRLSHNLRGLIGILGAAPFGIVQVATGRLGIVSALGLVAAVALVYVAFCGRMAFYLEGPLLHLWGPLHYETLDLRLHAPPTWAAGTAGLQWVKLSDYFGNRTTAMAVPESAMPAIAAQCRLLPDQ